MAKKQNDFASLQKDIRERSFLPVYFFEGEEPYFIDRLAALIVEHAIPEADKAFNQTILYGKETDVSTLYNQATRYPVFADKQLVVLREAQECRDLLKSVAIKRGNKTQEISLLAEYINRPLDSTILLIEYKHKKIDKRGAIGKKISSLPGYFSSEKLRDNQIAPFINALAKEKGIALQPESAALMAEFLGDDLSRIANELNKIVVSVGAGKTITAAQVREFVGISKEHSIFDLSKAIAKADVEKIYRMLDYFASNPKDNPSVLVISTLYNFFFKVFMVQNSRQLPRAEVAARVGVNEYFLGDYESVATRFAPQKISYVLRSLREADMQLKGRTGARFEDRDVYYELMFKILN